MSDPRKPDPFAAPIQLVEMELEPVREAAKAAVKDLRRFNEDVDVAVRTQSVDALMALSAPLTFSISLLRKELEKIGLGITPYMVTFVGRREQDALTGLQYLRDSVRLILARIGEFHTTDQFVSLEDELHLLEKGVSLVCPPPGSKAPPTSENSANNSRLFPGGVPDDPDIRDLVVQLDAELGKPKSERRSQRRIAQEFTNETGIEYDGSKAEKLVNQIRTSRNRGKITLDWN